MNGSIAPTVPALMALVHGQQCVGDERCFYCGAPADGSYPKSQHVKSSFTGLTGVVAPGSDSVCAGCVLCLREACEFDQVDGSHRVATVSAMRGYSWVITKDRALAATKAHLVLLRAICLSPPEPPFAVVLSDSGQTHQLYRGVVNHSGPMFALTLEARRVEFTPAALAERLALCGRLVAATGKPALSEPISSRFAMSVLERFPVNGEAFLNQWGVIRLAPLSLLAAWLSPKKEDCLGLYPEEQTA